MAAATGRTRNLDAEALPGEAGVMMGPLMLIFAIFLGSAITAAANISPGVGRFFNIDSDFDFWDITGSTYTYNEHHELPAKPGSTIRIFNLYGAVNVTPSDTDTIVVDVEKI